LRFALRLSQFHLLSTDQKPVAFFHPNSLDLHLALFVIKRVQHAETVSGPKAEFPGRFKRRGLTQGLAIASLLSGFELLQLLFNLRPNQRVVFCLNGIQVLLDRLVILEVKRLLACHWAIVEDRQGLVKPGLTGKLSSQLTRVRRWSWM